MNSGKTFAVVHLLFVVASLAHAQSYDFIRLDDPSLLPDAGNEFGWRTSQPPAINASGDVAFAMSTVGNRWAVFCSDGSAVTTISDTNSTPYVTFGPTVSINDAGVVAMAARLTTDLLVVAGNGGPLTTIAQTQEDGTTPTTNTLVSINNAGLVAYSNFYRDDQGLPRTGLNVGSGGPLTTVVDESHPTYSFFQPSSPMLDDAGRVLFFSFYRTGDPDTPTASGIFLAENGSVTELFEGPGRFSLNNAGQIAYSPSIARLPEEILLKSAGGIGTLLSSSLGIKPESELSLNDHGRVAFVGDDGGTRRLYMGSSGTTPDAILSAGTVLDGNVISSIRLSTESLNNSGQIAAQIFFEGGTSMHYRLDPLEFRWRNAEGGNWNDGAHWSIGQAPGSSGVAAIDLAGTYTITTTQNVAARELRVRRGDVTLGLSDYMLQVDDAVIGSPTSDSATLKVTANPTIVDGFVANQIMVGARGKVDTSGAGLYVGNVTLPATGQEAAGLFAAVHAKRSLVVQNGGQVDAFSAWVNGPAEPDGGGSAQVEIAGADSQVAIAARLLVGNHRPDSGVIPESEIFSTGKVRVLDGASLTAGTEIIVDSPSVDRTSSVTVQTSSLNTPQFTVGRRGNGELIANNARLSVDTLIIGDFGRPSRYQDAASKGKVVIEGPEGNLGPYLGVIPEVAVGLSGNAELVVRNGAQAHLLLGVGVSNASHGAKGTVMIEGITGAAVEQQTKVLAPSISIASDDRGGDGRVTISKGAVVSSQVVTVGVSTAAAGTGTLKVIGAGTRLNIGSSLQVGGVSQGTLEVFDQAVVEMPLGVLTIGANGHGELRRDARIVAGGVNIQEGGVLVGDRGTLVCPEELIVNHGTLRIGDSPGIFSIEGNYVQEDSGVVEIEIGGTQAIDDFDLLMIDGNADIDGTIILRFIDGFAPQHGQTFQFVSVSGLADLSKATIEIQNLRPGFDFEIVPSATGFALMPLSNGVFVPEPATVSLLSMVVVIAGGWRRGLRRQASPGDR